MPWWWYSKRDILKQTRTNLSVTTYRETQRKKKKKQPWGKSSYFTVQSALLFRPDCLSKVTDPWANVTSQSIGRHASGSNIVFFHLNWFVSSQIAYPRKLISQLGGINHGATLFQTRVLFANLLSVMPAKPRLWLPSLSTCWFRSYFSL